MSFHHEFSFGILSLLEKIIYFRFHHFSHPISQRVNLTRMKSLRSAAQKDWCQALKGESSLITPCLFAGHIWGHTKK